MTTAVLLAWASPVEGRDEEFARWLREVHVPEVCAAMGSVRQTTIHRRAEPGGPAQPARFMIVYELTDDDAAGAAAGMSEAVSAGRMTMSALMDVSVHPPAIEWYVRDTHTTA
jgi:hypothetical protein